jgi:hypothetical protein
MMLLTEPGTQIEGPEPEILQVMFSTLVLSLHADTAMTQLDAERIAMKIMVRTQARLAAAGYITRATGDPTEIRRLGDPR